MLFCALERLYYQFCLLKFPYNPVRFPHIQRIFLHPPLENFYTICFLTLHKFLWFVNQVFQLQESE